MARGPVTPSTAVGGSRRRPIVLAAVAAALVAAFTTLPRIVAGSLRGSRDIESLTRSVADGLVAYVAAGRASFGPGLAEAVDYWRAWHATKVVICALLLGVLVALARDLWRLHADGSGNGRTTVRWLATGVTVLVPLTAVALAANVQSTVAPSVALLQLLPGDAGGALGATSSEVQRVVTSASSAADWTPSVRVLVDAVRTYHLTMVVVVGLMVVVSTWTGGRSWARRRRTSSADGPRRAMLATVGTIATVTAVAASVLLVSEIDGAAHPAGTLVSLIGRG